MTDIADLRPDESSKRETRRDRLLEGAARCIGRLGFRKSTMEEIAAEAGVTRVTIYREFKNRQALIDALVCRRLAAFNIAFARKASRGKDLQSVICDYLLASVKTARDNVITGELINGSMDVTRPGSSVHTVSSAMWRPVFEDARVTGEAGSNVDIDDAVEWILIMQQTLCRFVIDTSVSEHRLTDMIRSFVLPAFAEAPKTLVRLIEGGSSAKAHG